MNDYRNQEKDEVVNNKSFIFYEREFHNIFKCHNNHLSLIYIKNF